MLGSLFVWLVEGDFVEAVGLWKEEDMFQILGLGRRLVEVDFLPRIGLS